MSSPDLTPHPDLPAESSAEAILRAGFAAANGPVKLACSFSVEDVVVVDLIQRQQLPIGLFALDTGRLNEETYQTAEAVRERYGVTIDWYFPERAAVEELERHQGLYSFRASLAKRHECCRIRKVEPLGRALAGLAGWVTGLRRAQSVTRSAVAALEHDAAHGDILKINPLLDWTDAEVWAYAEQEPSRGVSVYQLRFAGEILKDVEFSRDALIMGTAKANPRPVEGNDLGSSGSVTSKRFP